MALTKITSNVIATNAISGTLIADNAITAAHIAENAITQTQIAAAALSDALAANSITAAMIPNDLIDSDHYATASIDNEHLADDAVDSDELAAGAVDLAHMSVNSIDSDQYVDGSIDTAHIADDQVTLAKMAGLARGKIIYGDSSGNPTALAVGTNGQALVSDGTDIAWGSGSKSTEEIQDIVGGMFTGNTETNVTVTYQDGDGTIDVVGSAVTRTILRILARAGSFIDCTVTDATIPITARSGTVTVRKVSLPVQVIPQVATR